MEVCDELLEDNPDHNLANYIRGIHAKKQGKYFAAEEYLRKAIDAKGPADSMVNADAAFQLAYIYRRKKKYKEAMAWLSKAILLGSKEAETAFLSNKFLPTTTSFPSSLYGSVKNINSITTLMNTLILILAVNNTKLSNLSSSKWFGLWTSDVQKVFTKTLNTGGDNIKLITSWAIKHNPYLFYDLLNYCLAEKIINEANYQRFLDSISTSKDITDRHFKDKVNYSLFQVALKNKDWKAAYGHLTSLTTHFKDFNLEDAELIEDSNLFNHFFNVVADPEDNNHRVFLYKQQLLQQRENKQKEGKEEADIAKQNIPPAGVSLDHSVALPDHIRHCIKACIKLFENYINDREKRKKANPLRFFPGDVFFHNGSERTEYVGELQVFRQNEIMNDIHNRFANISDSATRTNGPYTQEAYKQVVIAFYQKLLEGKKQFPAGVFSNEMQKAFIKAEEIMQEVFPSLDIKKEDYMIPTQSLSWSWV